MGLSLRNIGKKITDVVGGAEHLAGNVARTAIVNPVRLGAAAVTQNPVAMHNAVQAQNRSVAGVLPVAQAIARTVPETVETAIHPFSQHSYNPTGKFQTSLFGHEPVQNIQKKVINNYQTHPGLNPVARVGLAGLEGAYSVAQDLPVAKLATSGSKVALKTVPTSKGALKVLDANQAGAVGKNVGKAKVVAKPVAEVKPVVTAKPIVTAVKPSKFDIAAKSTTDVLNKIDPRLGQMVKQRREIGEVKAAQAKDSLKITNSLNKDEQVNLARVMKGTELPTNGRVAAAAKESKKALDSIYYQAKNTGVDLPGYRKNYFPQIHNPKTFQAGTKDYDKAVAHLVKTKQAKSEADAIGQLRRYKDSRHVTPYQNLTKSRALDLPDYAENVAALHQYIDRAHASIAHVKVFGKEDKNLNRVLNQVRKNGGDVEQAIKSYKQASGLVRGSDTGEKVSRALTNFQGATKLGLSSIGNITQGVNTAAAGGIGRTIKNTVKKSFSKGDKEYVAKTGVADEQVAHEALFGEQGINKFRQVTAPFFEPIEKGNRATAALVGRDQARSLAKKAAKGDAGAADKLQRDFGITAKKSGKLTQAEDIQAGRSMVERTQFRTSPQDLPGWASTPTGKVLTQFKRYPYKQTQFLKREIIDEARRGNAAPLVRLAATSVPIGVGANYVQDKLRGNNFKESPVQKAANTLSYGGFGDLTLGTVSRLFSGAKDANAFATNAIKTLGGPTVGDTVNAAKAGFDAAKGDAKPVAREVLKHVPVVGSVATNRVLPYSTPSNATTNPDGSKKLTPTEQAKLGFQGKDKVFSFNGKDLSQQDFIKLSDADKKLAAETDPAARSLYNDWKSAKSAFQTPALTAPGLDDQSKSILRRYEKLNTTGRDAVSARENDWEYKYALAKYNNDKLNGKLTEVEDIRQQDALAKKYVGSKYSKTIRDSFGLAKKDLERYVTEHPDQAKDLLAYDQELYNNGLESSLKFKNGFSSGSGGSSSTTANNAYAYRLNTNVKARGVSGVRKPTVSIKSARKASSAGGSKPKVSLKKSMV